jgi:ubiquinone/menaquinone biosynthesis C-methylase UbiE
MQRERPSPFDSEANRYDYWFQSRDGKAIFEIEKDCLRTLVQTVTGLWLEVGIGSGRFAMSLGISEGVDPSLVMVTIAARRGIHVVRGIGEDLPFQDAIFDGILMVTTLCFLTSPRRALSECHRVVHPLGTLVVAIVPAASTWGCFYRAKGCEGHPLYSKANFYTCDQVIHFCAETGFVFERAVSCLFTRPGEEPGANLEEGINESAGFVAMRFQQGVFRGRRSK